MYALCHHIVDPYLLRKLTRQQTRIADELVALADEKGALFWKAYRNDGARLRFGPDRQSLGRSPNDHLRDRRICGQQEQQCLCRCIYHIWQEPMRNSANSMTLGAALAKR